MTRTKIGISIREDLLKKAQAAAAAEGRPLNDVIEVALIQYLVGLERKSASDVVSRTWGSAQLDDATLQAVLYEDVYDA